MATLSYYSLAQLSTLEIMKDYNPIQRLKNGHIILLFFSSIINFCSQERLYITRTRTINTLFLRPETADMDVCISQ